MKDRYGRDIVYLRWSITERCNLQCYYCTLQKEDYSNNPMSLDVIEKLSNIFKRLGFKYVRITGGEPTLRKDLVEVVEIMSERFLQVSLTTNGTLLADISSDLKKAGLSGVNVSLDSVNSERFLKITGRNKLNDVIDGIYAARKAGLSVKLNTVLLKENIEDISDLIDFSLKEKIPVRFIELMPFGNVKREDFISEEKAIRRISERYKLESIDEKLGLGPSSYYRIVSKSAEGIIGFIPAITHKFCDSCNKIRISSSGELLPCLAHPDVKVELLDVIDNEIELKERIKKAVELKPFAHNFNYETSSRFSMKRIGG